MNENKKLIFEDEKTLNLLDAFFYLLGKWKVMVAAAVILAVLAGGLSFVKSNRAYQASLESATVEAAVIELPEEELDNYLAKAAKIEEYEQNVAERDYYLENSIRVKLDPNGFYEGTAAYIFSSEKSSDAVEAAEYCKMEVLKADNLEALAKELSEETDPAMLNEVAFFEEKDLKADTAETVKVVLKTQHYNEADCDQMLSFLTDKMDAAMESLRAQGNSAKMVSVTPNVGITSDSSKMNVSADMVNARSIAYDNWLAAKESLSETEKAFYEQEKNKENPEEDAAAEEVLPEAAKPSVSMKLVVVGAAAGVFLAAAYYAVVYLFGGQVHNKEELESWLAVPVLDAHSSMEVTAAMVASMAEKAGAKKLYLTGSKEKILSDAAEVIRAALAEKNVTLLCGTDGLNTADALAQMAECGFVVFVEKCNESKEKDIRGEIEKASSCDVNVLGIVLEK